MKKIYGTLFCCCMTAVLQQAYPQASASPLSLEHSSYFANVHQLHKPNAEKANRSLLRDTGRNGIANDGSENLSDTTEVLALVGVANKYGFIDRKGREVIPVRYQSVGQDFNEGLLAVKLHGKWGFVGKQGRNVIPIQYDFAADFCEGLALVGIGNKYGYINKAGRVVIPFHFDGAGSFHKGLAMVSRQGKSGFIDQKGKAVIPIKYDFVYDFATTTHKHP